MARSKNKVEAEIVSWGLYDGWDPGSDELPTIREFTTDVPARLGVEFGFIVQIRRARGLPIRCVIDHPPFPGADGQPAPPFEDIVYVRANTYNFFLGDTLWDPIDDKLGPWRLTVYLDAKILADKTFHVA